MLREQNPSCAPAFMQCGPSKQVLYSVTGRWVHDESGLGSRTRNNGRSSVLGRFYENQMPSLFESAEQSEDFTVSSLILFRMS